MTPPGLNLCAQLQIDLARLKIFNQVSTRVISHNQGASEESRRRCEKYERAHNEIYGRLRGVGLDHTWIHPTLIRSLADEFYHFPVQAIYQGAGYDEETSRLIDGEFTDFAVSLEATAEELSTQNRMPILLELARFIRRSVAYGAAENDQIYEEIALMVSSRESDQPEMQRRLNEWARHSRSLPVGSLSSYDLLDLLVDDQYLPEVRAANEILLDLLERMDQLTYVPFVFGEIGVSVPIRVVADFAAVEPEPTFNIPQVGAAATGIRITESFANAVKGGRNRAAKFLANRGLKDKNMNFRVTLDLPDLRLVPSDDVTFNEVIYDQGSIEYPVAVALFLQNPSIKKVAGLNPEIMITGPTRASSLEAKVRTISTVGRVKKLVVVGERSASERRDDRVSVFRSGNDPRIFEAYLTSEIWEKLNQSKSRVLSFGALERWDGPLQKRPGKPPLISLAEKRLELTALMQRPEVAVAQLQGLPGIGKTYLLAQWLQEQQTGDSYDLILHTSVPASLDLKSLRRWEEEAFYDLARQLCDYWDRRGLQTAFNDNPALLSKDLIAALKDDLANQNVLWLIDGGEALLDENLFFYGSTFADVLNSVRNGDWSNSKLLFVTNRLIKNIPDLPILSLTEGFSFEQACEYLEKSPWKFSDLKERVARALGSHPRALALMVGYGQNALHGSDIYDLLDSLPAEGSEARLREEVCHRILGHIFEQLKPKESVWWALLFASTFVAGFLSKQLERIQRSVKPTLLARDKSLIYLEQLSLTNWENPRWTMHDLVRKYVQDVFCRDHKKEYQNAHLAAGRIFFPVQKSGRPHYPATGRTREAYASASGCAIAFYHYEKAGFEPGQRAILENTYDHLIPRARWWMENGAQVKNPTYGYYRAEKILAKIIRRNVDPDAPDSPYAGVQETSPDINVMMGVALHRQNQPRKYEQAEAHFRQAIADGKDEAKPLLVSVLCDLADDKLPDDPKWQEAERIFNEIWDDPRSKNLEMSYVGLGSACEKMARHYALLDKSGEYTLSLVLIEEASAREIKWSQVYLLGSEISERLRDVKGSEHWLQRGLDLLPRSTEIWKRLCLLKARIGQLSSISEALTCHPGGIQVSVDLSRSLMGEGLYAAAAMILKRALEDYPDSSALWTSEARLLERTGELQKAEEAYECAIKFTRRNGEPYLALGQLQLSKEDPDGARATYELGIKNAPTDGSLYLALGQLQLSKDDPDGAQATYDLGIKLCPAFGGVYLALGQLQLSKEDPDGAQATYDLGIKLCPTWGAIYLALGQLKLSKDDPDGARATYELGIENAPTDGQLYLALGQLQLSLKNPDGAQATYDLGIKLCPAFGPIYLALGQLQLSKGDPGGARATYELGIKRAPTDGSLYLALGQLQLSKDDPDGARATYELGIKNAPTNGQLYYRLVLLLLDNSDVESARTVSNAAVWHASQDQYSELALAEVHLFSQEFVQAERLCKHGIEDGSFSGWFGLGVRILEQKGELDDAISLSRRWCEVFPRDGNSYMSLISLLLPRVQTFEARAEISRVLQMGLSECPAYKPLQDLIDVVNQHQAVNG